MMYSWLRRLLFCLPAEFTHHFTLTALRWLYPSCRVQRIQKKFPKKPVNILNLSFPNPIGLAAGLDKDGIAIDALYGLGFGFIEVGAVTPRPQPGNPKPRLFRLPLANALINRFGFNNRGVDHLVLQLKKRKVVGIVGVNIGKNFDTPLENAFDDYAICFQKVYAYADFVTINISSPNTIGLRELQGRAYLLNLLTEMKQLQHRLAQQHQKHVPLFVKIAPDLTDEEIDAIAKISLSARMEGIIAVNTTQDREAVQGLQNADQAGGLSGQPLFAKTVRVIRRLHQQTQGEMVLIAVGGVFTPQDAKILLALGASLVQVYTGLIYEGPGLIKKIIQNLNK